MCGIAGVLYKDPSREHDIGRALVEMLYGCQHRGEDSTGFALYGKSETSTYILRFIIGEGAEAEAAVARIRHILDEFAATILEDEIVASNYRVVVSYQGEIQPFAYALENGAKVISIGTRLEIVKDVGDARDVDGKYDVCRVTGSHGIGHVRLATESDVRPEAAHPFWATGFADIAIVHNGQITNYWKMRRALENRDYEFRTDNDSELIAVLLADKLKHGATLHDALASSIEELDGTFSFLVSTEDEIGFAKDHLAAKPMVMYEGDDLVAIASEEVSLNRLFPGAAVETTEPLPGTFRTWSK